MSDISERIDVMVRRVHGQVKHIKTEEATKLALINPFIRDVLGYDTTDLTQVIPEYVADVGIKQGEKVDYAIMYEGEPSILIEAKKTGTPLDREEPSQLFRYFTALDSAVFGIYTDGVKYLFYTDVDKQNVMDTSPFLTLDLADVASESLDVIARFVNGEFVPSAIREGANELKYVRFLKAEISRIFKNPSPEVVRAFMTDAYDGSKTAKAVESFTGYVKTAANLVFEERMRERLNAAMHTADEPTEINDVEPDVSKVSDREIHAFSTVKALLYDVIDVSRLYLREMSGYTMVIVDDSVLKPVCKLKLRTSPYSVEMAGRADGKRIYRPISVDGVEGIYELETELETVAKEYGEEGS